MAWKRNIGKHTSAEDAKRNILLFCLKYAKPSQRPATKSTLGYQAYPDYNFGAPQGAAFSVAKIVSQLEGDGLLRFSSNEYHRGYFITLKGQEAAKQWSQP